MYMATRTQSRPTNSSRSRGSITRSSSSNESSSSSRSGNSSDRSAFSWGDNAGPLLGAAIAGMAIGFAANYGRQALLLGLVVSVGE